MSTRLKSSRSLPPTVLALCLTMAACDPAELPDTPPSVKWVTIPASDDRVQYTGRTYDSGTGVIFSHPGVTVRARFWGDALRMRLNDAGLGGATGTNFFDVVIDGAEPKLLEVRRSQSFYELATDLTEGLHTVELMKRTESSVGHSEFVAFEVHGEPREPPARPELKMEFIGDSITCGYGNDITVFPRPPPWSAPTFTSKNENHRRTYGWLTAQRLGAESVHICYSGRGVYRNLDASRVGRVPDIYELAVPDHPATWDFSGESPDVIVINAGTNDTFAGSGTAEYLPDETAFKAAYRAFLGRLRTLHPRAHIICTMGTMTDGYKEAEGNGGPPVESVHVGHWLTDLVAERNQQGDARVYRHVMTVQDPAIDGVGEDWHPSAGTHAKMAEALGRFIEDVVRP
ncbi:SGNH/GDSL hydrolase family protein [Myxococcus sp. AM011]|uniref:SGNH/GDSL hydrolase family protein n=1 Tax=Myxococcus sp. AM011 TaxID=2745200 RepID=UPI001594EC35|nr:SGNH/GDSL hydrolase family protein [Myxococcus sp. AM011]NVJ22253.1 SGNH/GDSL hydrolase family protein [Myxococcus sp. AM011]